MSELHQVVDDQAAMAYTGIVNSILRRGLRGRVRGATRLTCLVAEMSPRLRQVAVTLDKGSLFVDLREASGHGLFAGDFPEKLERALVGRCVKSGQVVFDIGAHWGLYTVQLANQVGPSGRVFAFEPSPTVLPCLTRTVQALANVTLLRVAASDTASTASLLVPADASMASFGDWTAAGHDVRRYAIETVRIDDLLRDGTVPIPDFVKCDVEGAEALALRGAATLLNRTDAPVLMLEMNPRASAALGLKSTAALDVVSGLHAARYSFYSLGGDGQLLPLREPGERVVNVFAVPARRQEWLQPPPW